MYNDKFNFTAEDLAKRLDVSPERAERILSMTLLGTVAAGKPLLSEENVDGYVTIAEPFVRPGKTYFALRVRGSSMINAGILEGDLAIIEKADVASEGQIVVGYYLE